MPRTHVRHRFALPMYASALVAMPPLNGHEAEPVSATARMPEDWSAVGAAAEWAAADARTTTVLPHGRTPSRTQARPSLTRLPSLA